MTKASTIGMLLCLTFFFFHCTTKPPVKKTPPISPSSSTFALQSSDFKTDTQALQTELYLILKSKESFAKFQKTVASSKVVRLNLLESVMNSNQNPGTYETKLKEARKVLDLGMPNLLVLTQKHKHLLIPVEKMPFWLSSSQDQSKFPTHPHWLTFHTAPPKDLKIYTSFVVDVLKYLRSKLPKDVKLSIEVWNEPDLSWSGTSQQLFALYEALYKGLKALSPEIQVGGLALNHQNGKLKSDNELLYKLFFAFLKRNKVGIDFYSFHIFSPEVSDGIGKITQELKKTLASYNLSGLPLVVSEWNMVSAYRGSFYQPGFFLESIAQMRGDIDQIIMTAWQDLEPKKNWSGYGLLMYDGQQPKDLFRIFEKLELMKGLPTTSKRSGPLRLHAGVSGSCLHWVVWSYMEPPPVTALKFLTSKIPTSELAKIYKSANEIWSDVQKKASRESKWSDWFAKTHEVLLKQQKQEQQKQNVTIALPSEHTYKLMESTSLNSRLLMQESRESFVVKVEVKEGKKVVLELKPHAVQYAKLCQL